MESHTVFIKRSTTAPTTATAGAGVITSTTARAQDTRDTTKMGPKKKKKPLCSK